MQEEDTRQKALKDPEGSIFGSLLETQPVERHSTKYGDNLWPSKDYPTYVSGGGFLMNKKAAMALQELLTTSSRYLIKTRSAKKGTEVNKK